VLGTLVYDYEDKNELMPILKGVELLKALLEEANLQPKNLVPICQSESIVLDVLNGERELTASQIKELAAFFHISPTAFFE
jgi:HTH-type transcriptional regulator/antitoxin HigA